MLRSFVHFFSMKIRLSKKPESSTVPSAGPEPLDEKCVLLPCPVFWAFSALPGGSITDKKNFLECVIRPLPLDSSLPAISLGCHLDLGSRLTPTDRYQLSSVTGGAGVAGRLHITWSGLCPRQPSGLRTSHLSHSDVTRASIWVKGGGLFKDWRWPRLLKRSAEPSVT